MNEKLRNLGLSSYEAKAYLALLKQEVADAREIARFSNSCSAIINTFHFYVLIDA